jgi:hypothetical protein
MVQSAANLHRKTRLQVFKVICHCDDHNHLYEKHLNLIMIVQNKYRAKLQGRMQGKL